MTQTNLFSEDAAKSLKKEKPMTWSPTREAGLARLAEFVPYAGIAYTRSRNTDFGPTNRSNVSALSPWLSRRIITEEEVVKAVLKQHSFGAAEKFIQEVFWRTYWKGWLELRPDVLVNFNKDRLELNEKATADRLLQKRLETAMNGATGIECFDAWVEELREIGWLHNHARMWFASIWIFTLKLPWQLGADFFYKNLLDADAASNTLSWRWVAGLHSKGKHYLARASNIRDHSGGRFNPSGQLNETAQALVEDYMVPGPSSLSSPQTPKTERVGLLITEEDLHPASWQIGAHPMAVATFTLPQIGDPDQPRNVFTQEALHDARVRSKMDFNVEIQSLNTIPAVVEWAKSLGVTEIVTAYAPWGLTAWALADVAKALKAVHINLVFIRRDWDTRTWPLATGGFFKLKDKLPFLIKAL